MPCDPRQMHTNDSFGERLRERGKVMDEEGIEKENTERNPGEKI